MDWYYPIDLFLHLDDHLRAVIQDYGIWTYALLFLIVFLETGLVITPILPGDSLLFAAGAFAANGSLNLAAVIALFFAAAVLGDAVNYMIGYYVGPKALRGNRWLKKEWLDKTHRFYERYGAKTIVIARFVPIVRTIAPFLAGVGRMNYFQFAQFNVLGAGMWVGICVVAGYLFGNIPIVEKNFSLVVLGIVFVSILPMIVEFVRARKQAQPSVTKPD